MEQATPLLEDTTRDLAQGNFDSRRGTQNPELGGRDHQPRWRNIKARVLDATCVFYNVLPRYLRPGGRAAYSQARHSPTAYLDAVRGYAAIVVFFYHGWNKTTPWILQLPLIRTFVLGGPGMVAVFFVISGYVLSYRILKLMHNKDTAALLDALSSSMFRRWLRLYGSTAVATFAAACCVSLGWYLPVPELAQPTFLAQIWHWLLSTLSFSNPFANIEGWIHEGALYTPYLMQMWTIPIEFRGSIVLFCFCVSAAKMSVRSRMIYLWVVVLLSYYWRSVYVPEFLYGMFLAELSFYRHPERLDAPVLPSGENEKPELNRVHVWLRMGSPIALIIGLLLLGQPDPPDLGAFGPFPFPYLVRLIPPWFGDAAYTFWLSIGAFLVVLALDSSPTLQKPFNWSFSQYIGDLSFGIYAMHTIWISSLYKGPLLTFQAAYLGNSYPAYIPGILIVSLCVLCSADYFRQADRMVVNAGRWLQTKTFRKWQ